MFNKHLFLNNNKNRNEVSAATSAGTKTSRLSEIALSLAVMGLLSAPTVNAANDIIVTGQTYESQTLAYPVKDYVRDHRNLFFSDSNFIHNLTEHYNDNGYYRLYSGAGISVYNVNEQPGDTDLTVLNSYFTGNNALDSGGAINLNYSTRLVYIDNSIFDGNSGNFIADLLVFAPENTTVTVKDSVFKHDNFISVGLYGSNRPTFNVIADSSDMIFTLIPEKTDTDYFAYDVYVEEQADINLNAGQDHSVELHAGLQTWKGLHNKAGDINNVRINVNKPDIQYTAKSLVEDNTVVDSTKTAPSDGTVKIYGPFNYADIHTYGGTLALLPADNSWVEGRFDVVRTQLGLETSDSGIYNNIAFLNSNLTVESDTLLKSQDVDPLTHEAYTAKDEVALLKIAQGVKFQTIMLGSKLTLNGNLNLQPAVNLETKETDKFRVGDGQAEITGAGKLMVNGWIVKADYATNESVTVDLAAADEKNLRSYFGLSDSGTVAYGPVYVWTVTHDDGSSEYTFVRRNAEPEAEKPDSKKEVEDEIASEISESGDDDEIAKLDELFEIVDDSPINHISDTPFNYNPDIYGEQVAALGMTIIQNAISDMVFSEMRIGQIDYLLKDEKPSRKQWWGRISGADLNLRTKNFYNINVDYALAMIGHQFDPIRTAYGDVEFGAYIGAAAGMERYSISKVKQNGGFAGVSVLYETGNAWVAGHANFGIMTNHLKGITRNQTTNPWVGLGLSAGYNFVMPNAGMVASPFVDLSYVNVKAKDYTTTQGTRVHNASLNSFEVSPGLRLAKQFDQGWSVHGQARYAIVSKHDGKTKEMYENDTFMAVPCITNKNYVEYGLAVQKQAKNWGVAMNVNRSDGGRTGWSGMFRVSYSF